jgi:predicted acetyltransferase
MSPSVALHPATSDDRSVIARLIQLYLYDMAAETPFPLQDNGLYEYDHLDAFWQYPYLLRIAGDLVGFALVTDHCPITGRTPCWFMAEYFVLRPYRRHGVGRHAARALFARHPGPWHIATTAHNHPAARFWPKAIPQPFTQSPAHHDGMDWTVRAFTVPG